MLDGLAIQTVWLGPRDSNVKGTTEQGTRNDGDAGGPGERASKGGAMEIEARIRGLMMDPLTNMPIVVLKDVGSEAVMPIWVGIFEANAIALEIEKTPGTP